MTARQGDTTDLPDGDPDLPHEDAVETDFTVPADADVETGAEPDQPA